MAWQMLSTKTEVFMQKGVGSRLKCWLVASGSDNSDPVNKQVYVKRSGLVDITTLSRHLSISKNTIYSWVNQRRIPYHKVGSLLRFDINEIDEWLKEHKKETNLKWEVLNDKRNIQEGN
jgi:excisionase family DNA binding protein